MLSNGLNLGDDAEKNAEVIAASTAAAAHATGPAEPSSASRAATASIRVSLAWVPYPPHVPDEESVLVLTAPTGHYVDIRIKLPAAVAHGAKFSDASTNSTSTAPASLGPTNDPANVPSGSTLSWGFAGFASRTPDGKGGRWTRVVDSRTPTIDPSGEVDEGQEVTLPNGDTKETGVMDGKEYIEIWRGLDVGGGAEKDPDAWVAVKEGPGAGMVVRVGGWAQGVARSGKDNEVSAFRARTGEGGSGWKDVWRVGREDVFPMVGGNGNGWEVVGGPKAGL
jgi:hypothetical protein